MVTGGYGGGEECWYDQKGVGQVLPLLDIMSSMMLSLWTQTWSGCESGADMGSLVSAKE